MDYAVPRADDLPSFRDDATVTTTLSAADQTTFSGLWTLVGIYTNKGTQLKLADFEVTV